MNTYLLHRGELGIIADALRAYQERHCGNECPRLSDCAAHDSCGKVSGDLDRFRTKVDRIEFIEDNPAIFEALKTFAPAQAEPRWLSDFSRFRQIGLMTTPWMISKGAQGLGSSNCLSGTSGIRGVFGQDLSVDFCREVAQAIGTMLAPRSKVCIGTDTRVSRETIKGAVVSGLCSSGIDVTDLSCPH